MIKLSPLEDFVKKYLKGIKKAGNTRAMMPFVEKAIALIRIKLGENCCGPDAGTPITYTRQDNDFTYTVRYLIKKMYGPGTDKILRKVLHILEVFAGYCCEVEVTIDWTNVGPESYILTFSLVTDGPKLSYVTGSTDNPQTIRMKPGNYDISIEVLDDTTGSTVVVNDDTGEIINIPGDVPPLTGSAANLPLSTTYTVSLNDE